MEVVLRSVIVVVTVYMEHLGEPECWLGMDSAICPVCQDRDRSSAGTPTCWLLACRKAWQARGLKKYAGKSLWEIRAAVVAHVPRSRRAPEREPGLSARACPTGEYIRGSMPRPVVPNSREVGSDYMRAPTKPLAFHATGIEHVRKIIIPPVSKRVPHLPPLGQLTWLTVALRDGWECYLCGQTCSRESGEWRESGTWKRGPLYPTLEHVIPRAKRGPHTASNVRLACSKCNSSKGVQDLATYAPDVAGHLPLAEPQKGA